MIQELLGGGAGLIGGERKITINGGILEASPSPSPSPSPSSSSSGNTTTVTTAAAATTSSASENLRCPRCDSSNTKFCYYNNYNLTQPRHFCKTCRRYWTKGGALRNVPIGGGCRKNKNTSVSTAVGKSSAGKAKSAVSEIGKSGLGGGFDHEIPSNPILWASPQNSHLLALLRATQNPNPNPSPISNSVTVKDDGVMIGSHMTSESGVGTALTGETINIKLNSTNKTATINSKMALYLVKFQNTGIQELYQRLRSSTNYYTDHSPVVLSNAVSSSSSILESAPIAGGELGYWNPTFSWSDLPTTNGAYP
uniref:Dof-type domain-containing protein n=1 Tax=Vitis vinifera TaxID=29760 RepID=A5BNX3_VITVI|nr:hypothetical protein VITISV_028751 [Vitis vinifera]